MGWRAQDLHARGSAPRVPLARSVRAGLALALLLPHLTGCFHYVPTSQAALPGGTEVSVGLTDRGRVALFEQLGPGVRHFSGRVLESTDTSLVLSVTAVQYIDIGGQTPWPGERVEVARQFISDLRERQLSRPRTTVFAGLILAGLVASSLIVITGTGGRDPIDQPGPGNGGEQ